MNIGIEIARLGLGAGNSIVISSGILQTLGIRKSRDIDLVVDKETYSTLQDSGIFATRETFGKQILEGGCFEIADVWNVLGRSYDFEDLKGKSIVVGSVRYVDLGFLLEVKKHWVLTDASPREKDVKDIHLIESYLAGLS